MNLKSITLAVGLLSGVIVSMAAVPSEWKLITNDSFTFRLPADMKKIDYRGIDSFVEAYESRAIRLSFDFGKWSNNFQGWPAGTQYQELNIDGRKARIGTIKQDFGFNRVYSTQVHFPEVDPKHKGMKLSMSAACASENDVDRAHNIFKSVRFARE